MPDHSPIEMEKAEEREPATAFSVPALPSHFVARAKKERVVEELLYEVPQREVDELAYGQEPRMANRSQYDQAQRVVLTADVSAQEADGCELSGFGLTTLAMAVCHDARIVDHFPDGIRWLTLGPQPDLLQLVNGLGRSFDAQWSTYHDLNLAVNKLHRYRKKALIVLHDVWSYDHVMPFLCYGSLITTRLPDLAADNTGLDSGIFSYVVINQMSVDEATALLSKMIGAPPYQEPLRALALYLGGWPLLLELVGAQVRHLRRNQKSVPQAVGEVRSLMEAHGFTPSDVQEEEARLRALEITLSVSLDQLQALGEASQNWRERYAELAIFPEYVEIPGATIFNLWQETADFEPHDSQQALFAMRDLCLLRYDSERQTVRLPAAPRKVLGRQQVDHHAALHEALLVAHQPASGKWADLPSDEPYMWHHLASHLCAAGQVERLGELLLEFDWLQARLKATQISGLMADYDRYLTLNVSLRAPAGEEGDIERLQRAFSQAWYLLGEDKSQLVGQLWGHLAADSSKALQRLLYQAASSDGSLHLRPLTPSLQAHPALIRTLRGHPGGVSRMTVVEPQLISTCESWGIKAWDLASGSYMYSLETEVIHCIGMWSSPDGQWLILADGEFLLEVWDMFGRKLVTILDLAKESIVGQPIRSHVISEMIVAGERIILALGDQMTVWDLTGDLLHVLVGHTEHMHISALALTPDEREVISASYDHTLKVWDLASGGYVYTLTGHTDKVLAVTVTPDGQRVISASEDQTLKIWDLASGECLHTLRGHTDNVNAVVVTPDGERIISVSDDQTLKIWNLAGQLIRSLPHRVSSAYWVPLICDEQRIISASWDQTIKVWDVASGQLLDTLTGHTDRINYLLLSPDGQQIISASNDRTIKIWRAPHSAQWGDMPVSETARTTLAKAQVGHTKPITALAITPDGQHVISASRDKTLKIWALASGQLLQSLTGHTGSITALAVGQQIISASDDKTIKVWDLASGDCLHTLTGHTGCVNTVAVTSDGQRIVSASDDKTIKVWRAGMPVWDMTAGCHLHTLTDHTDAVNMVAITPDGQRIVSASDDKTIKVWDMTTGHHLHTLTGHTRSVDTVIVTPDGQRIISVSAGDKSVKVWDLASGQQLHTFVGIAPVAVTPDGKKIISTAEESSRKWKLVVRHLTSGRLLNRLTGYREKVTDIAVVEQLIISASEDTTVDVWRAGMSRCELATAQHLTSFYLNEKPYHCAVTPDGQTVVAGGKLGRVHIFRLENGAESQS